MNINDLTPSTWHPIWYEHGCRCVPVLCSLPYYAKWHKDAFYLHLKRLAVIECLRSTRSQCHTASQHSLEVLRSRYVDIPNACWSLSCLACILHYRNTKAKNRSDNSCLPCSPASVSWGWVMAAACSRAAFHCEWALAFSWECRPASRHGFYQLLESRSGQVGFVLIILVIKGTNKAPLSGSTK